MHDEAFSGKTVLITGASMGLGEAFARELASRGATTVLVARSEDRLARLAAELGRSHVVVADLTAPGAAGRVLAATRALGLEVDVLVNNAGFGLHARFDDPPAHELSEMIDLNVRALVELTRAYLPELERRRGGVLQVASMAAVGPVPYMAVYAATKAFVRSFGVALWAEMRPRGVRVTTLFPGATETAFFVRAGEAASAGVRRARPADVVRAGLTAFAAGRATAYPSLLLRVLAAVQGLLGAAFVAGLMERWIRPPVRP